jgi:hypothetical protein
MTMDARTPSSDATGRCVVKIAGVWIDTASFRWGPFFLLVQDSGSFVERELGGGSGGRPLILMSGYLSPSLWHFVLFQLPHF